MRAHFASTARRLIFWLAAACAVLCGKAQAQNFTYTNNGDGTLTITGYTGPNAVTIPSTILVNGVNLTVSSIGVGAFLNTGLTRVRIPDTVTSIGAQAFDGCTNLTLVIISNNVSIIGNYTFANCTSLTNVTIPNSVTSIGEWAFYYCTSLTSVTIGSGVTTIGGNAFYNCSSLTSVTIPSSVTSIGDLAFTDTNLTSVTIGNNVTSIGEYAFSGTSLTSVIIPNSVISIGEQTFQQCTNLISVTIGNNVTSIGEQAFDDCPLTSITIPKSVTSIGEWAFIYCSKLTSAFFTGNAPNGGFEMFSDDSNATVYYLPGTSGWGSTFAGVPAMMILQPAITTPSVSAAVVAGSNTTFNVVASGVPAPSYQWQVSMDGGNSWNDVSGNVYAGATTANLAISNATTAQLGYQYQAVLTNFAGTTTTTPVPLVVGTSSAQLTWLQNNFTAAQLGHPGIVGDTAEPAGDGIPNLLKYAFNLNPWVEGQPFLPQPVFATGNLTLTFPTPQADINYTVEASADLFNWSTAGVTQTSDPANGTETGSYGLAGTGPVFLQIMVAPATTP